MINELKCDFNSIFNEDGEKVFFSPGRVNLIGEHTDYNGGNVFPCALDMGTYAVVSKREDKIIRAYSKNFEELGIIEFSLEDLVYEKAHDWVNYPKGVENFNRWQDLKLKMALIFYSLGIFQMVQDYHHQHL